MSSSIFKARSDQRRHGRRKPDRIRGIGREFIFRRVAESLDVITRTAADRQRDRPGQRRKRDEQSSNVSLADRSVCPCDKVIHCDEIALSGTRGSGCDSRFSLACRVASKKTRSRVSVAFELPTTCARGSGQGGDLFGEIGEASWMRYSIWSSMVTSLVTMPFTDHRSADIIPTRSQTSCACSSRCEVSRMVLPRFFSSRMRSRI